MRRATDARRALIEVRRAGGSQAQIGPAGEDHQREQDRHAAADAAQDPGLLEPRDDDRVVGALAAGAALLAPGFVAGVAVRAGPQVLGGAPGAQFDLLFGFRGRRRRGHRAAPCVRGGRRLLEGRGPRCGAGRRWVHRDAVAGAADRHGDRLVERVEGRGRGFGRSGSWFRRGVVFELEGRSRRGGGQRSAGGGWRGGRAGLGDARRAGFRDAGRGRLQRGRAGGRGGGLGRLGLFIFETREARIHGLGTPAAEICRDRLRDVGRFSGWRPAWRRRRGGRVRRGAWLPAGSAPRRSPG